MLVSTISPDYVSQPVPPFLSYLTAYVINISHFNHLLVSNSGFCSMKRLGVFLLPLDGMLVNRRSLPRNLLGFPNNLLIPIYTPGGERHYTWESSVLPKNTTQCPRLLGSNPDPSLRERAHGDERTNHETTTPPINLDNSSAIWSAKSRSSSTAVKFHCIPLLLSAVVVGKMRELAHH